MPLPINDSAMVRLIVIGWLAGCLGCWYEHLVYTYVLLHEQLVTGVGKRATQIWFKKCDGRCGGDCCNCTCCAGAVEVEGEGPLPLNDSAMVQVRYLMRWLVRITIGSLHIMFNMCLLLAWSSLSFGAS
jgi:hypothetical protein